MPRIISRQKKAENKKDEKEQGIGRLLWLLALVVLLLAVMMILPMLQNRESKADSYTCMLAVRKAQEAVLVEFLSNHELTKQEAAVIIDESKLARDELCPAGGDYYMVPRGDGSWYVACGLHEENDRVRTQINASHVFDLIQDQLSSRRRLGLKLEQDLILKINGKALDVILLPGDNGLRRGTDYSIDFDGVVSFFSLNSAGEVNWFVYADANHAAVWKMSDGWSGDAYPQK